MIMKKWRNTMTNGTIMAYHKPAGPYWVEVKPSHTPSQSVQDPTGDFLIGVATGLAIDTLFDSFSSSTPDNSFGGGGGDFGGGGSSSDW